MSVLESFYILFKGDNTDVKQKAKETERVTQNLQDALTGSFRKTEQQTKSTARAFGELARAAVALTGATAAAYTIFNKTLAASELAGRIGLTAQALNVNVRELDAWSQATVRAGGSAEGFQQSLVNLSKHFGANAQVTLKILPRLADAFKRLGNYRAQYYGRLLGLDQGTILLLQQGRREVEGVITRVKELGVVTERDVEVSNKFKVANFELSLAFRALYLELAQTVIPALTKVYNAFIPIVDYLKRHKDLIIGAFIGIGIAAAIMVAPFILANLAIFATLGAITALIALFALAYEDVKAYFEGSSSLLGDYIKRWHNAKNVLKDVFTAIGKYIETFFGLPIKKAMELAEKFLSLFPSFKASLESSESGGLGNGRRLIDILSPAPIATASANAFTSRSFSRNSAINTGDIIINTQANDASGIADSFKDHLYTHYQQANNQFADGEAY